MTLFGMNDKKKRGIVVPVMALAVCAVAMVGLGFALETSVTSDLNVENVLMIDLAKEQGDLGDTSPSPNTADSVLDFGLQTIKKTENSSTTVSYSIEGGEAYLKIYGNTASVNLTVSVTKKGFENLTGLILTLTDNSDRTYTADISLNGEAQFSGTISSGIYTVKITKLSGTVSDKQGVTTNCNLEYSGSSWSGNGSFLAEYFDGEKNSLKYEFKAVPSS